MKTSNSIPDNLIEIIPYIERGDYQTARKHLNVYARSVETRISKAAALSRVAPPLSSILADVDRALAVGSPSGVIEKLKDFDAAYIAFVSGIPSYKRSTL